MHPARSVHLQTCQGSFLVMQHLSFTFWVTKSACKPPRCVPARHSPVITLDKCLPTALPQLGLFGMEFNFIPFVEEHSLQIYRVNT